MKDNMQLYTSRLHIGCVMLLPEEESLIKMMTSVVRSDRCRIRAAWIRKWK